MSGHHVTVWVHRSEGGPLSAELLAHSKAKSDDGSPQSLEDHLLRVAELARTFGAPLGLSAACYSAGLVHDLGKAAPAFQQYLAAAIAGRPMPRGSVEHKAAGALYLANHGAPAISVLAPVVLGHHGGLPDSEQTRRVLSGGDASPPPHGLEEVLLRLPADSDVLEEINRGLSGSGREAALQVDMLVRMAYSCLVDADSRDTAEHFNGERSPVDVPTLAQLWERLALRQDEMIASADKTLVNRLRAEVYRDCLAAADSPPGLFTLTVPTGGGKTLSSLAFALDHALRNGMERIIYVIPYTSIIEQTAAVFRNVLGDPDAVLEHHSTVIRRDGEEAHDEWRRSSCEDWDAPIIVTTAVQFFESLFASRPGRARKVHRMGRSVVIFDEAQTLPLHVDEPCADVLRRLVESYGSSVVLCTATQSGLLHGRLPESMHAREIVSDPAGLFAALKRVRYEMPEQRWDWERVAFEMSGSGQCLVIVNSRRDARSLLELAPSGTLHLSTSMCPAHRRAVLDIIRDRLVRGLSCRVVSTQLIEAGVDVDFPVVMRAFGPLDSLAQAAGRCNREGKLESGRVVIFKPEKEILPQGSYRTALAHARIRLAEGADLASPTLFAEYFSDLRRDVNTDRDSIQDKRRRLDFRQVSEAFRMIDDETLPVIVPFDVEVAVRLESLLVSSQMSRGAWADLQQHSISMFERDVELALRANLAERRGPGDGFIFWRGVYDERIGVVERLRDPADRVF